MNNNYRRTHNDSNSNYSQNDNSYYRNQPFDGNPQGISHRDGHGRKRSHSRDRSRSRSNSRDRKRKEGRTHYNSNNSYDNEGRGKFI